MVKWTIVGQILDSSGYSSHCRQLFNALAKDNDVKLQTGLTPDWLMQVNDKELEAIKKEDSLDRIKIIITHPVYWRVNATNKINYAYMVWEGLNIPKSFIDEMLNPEIHKIIVPSNHTLRSVLYTCDESVKSTIQDKLTKISHGVNHEIFKPIRITDEQIKNEIERVPKKFTFLVNKGFRNSQDRGGTQYTLKAFIEEFSNKDNVRLLVKINPAYGIPDLNKILSEYKDRVDLPEIVIDTNSYKYEQLNNLYNQADVFVSTTRAEGFNLPVIEAFACGLPAIVTGYSGQCDFAKDNINSLYVDYEMTEVKHEVQYEGNFWATPKIESIREKLRFAYEHPEIMKVLGQRALETSKEYDWNFTANKFAELGK